MFVKTNENNDAAEKLFFRYEIEQKVKQIEETTNGKCKR